MALKRHTTDLETQIVEKDAELKRQDVDCRAEIRKLHLEHVTFVDRVSATMEMVEYKVVVKLGLTEIAF